MKHLKIVSVFVCAFVLCFALAACGGSNASKSTSSSTSNQSTTKTESAGAIELTADDLASPEITVEFGDYDAMEALANDIQNGDAADKVVEIDGLVSHFADGMSYNIVENNADNSGNIGTVFVIIGAEDADYPEDETHVKLRGKVAMDEGGSYYLIYTLPDFVQAAE